MRRLVVAALASAACAATLVAGPVAHAADMAVPGSSYYPPAAALPPAFYDWTGFYVGGHIGGAILSDEITQLAGAPPVAINSNINLAPPGFIAGVQGGVNYEFAPWVVGAEVSWTDSLITGSANALTAAGQETMTSNPQWFGAVTGRVGYAANDLLFYLKGGGALMKVNYEQDVFAAGIQTSAQTVSDTRGGFTAGAGIEYGLTEALSARLEYDFYGFGTRSYPAFTQTPVSVGSHLQTLTFALNYRFNPANGHALNCPTC